MKANPKRAPGFYWVRFEGDIVVAEYTDGSGCEGSDGKGHWHIPGSDGWFMDREVCELLSGKIPHRPIPIGLLRKAIAELREWSRSLQNSGEYLDRAKDAHAIAIQLGRLLRGKRAKG